MADNTVKTEDGAEIYINNIYYYADQYIKDILDIPEEDKYNEDYKKRINDNFVSMILYIKDHIKKPSNDDIVLLDNIFNAYVNLCIKYNYLPTLEIFSFLVSINNGTFSDWADGQYRASSGHGETVKKWKNICKAFTVNRLSNSPGTNANLIFIAKAAYGMVEAPQQVQIIGGQQPEQIAADIAARHMIGQAEPPKLPEDL